MKNTYLLLVPTEYMYFRQITFVRYKPTEITLLPMNDTSFREQKANFCQLLADRSCVLSCSEYESI
jgi:hypothetical protein